MKTRTRIALYGGTFSPPHLGHARAAEAFASAVAPDKLLIVPSSLPPHKAPVLGATNEDRLAMCRIAFSHIPGVEISDMEMRRSGKSYTVETLRALSGEDTDLVMLIGTDMFLTLDTWYCAEEIFRLAEIAVIRRETEPLTEGRLLQKEQEYRKRYAARVLRIPCEATEISSSELRERISMGLATNEYLNPDVEEYIKVCQLYRE